MGKFISLCSKCGLVYGVQDSKTGGLSLSHGYCKHHKKKIILEMKRKRMQKLVKERKVTCKKENAKQILSS